MQVLYIVCRTSWGVPPQALRQAANDCKQRNHLKLCLKAPWMGFAKTTHYLARMYIRKCITLLMALHTHPTS